MVIVSICIAIVAPQVQFQDFERIPLWLGFLAIVSVSDIINVIKKLDKALEEKKED
jgi:uncharacterized membrane protein YkvI